MNRSHPTRAVWLVVVSVVIGPQLSAQELSLGEAVEAALASHPALGAAVARADGAEATASAARAQLLPSVASSASLTRFQEPMLVAPLHALDPNSIPSFETALVRGELVAQYTLFEGGARAARIRGAEAGAGAAHRSGDRGRRHAAGLGSRIGTRPGGSEPRRRDGSPDRGAAGRGCAP
jgi:hypothetical protein